MEPTNNTIDEILGTPEEVAVPVEVTPEAVEVLSPSESTQESVLETVVVDSTNNQETQEVVPEGSNIEPGEVLLIEGKVEETPNATGEKQEIVDERRNPDGTIKPGHTLNPNGRPKGSKSLSTLLKNHLINTMRKTAEGESVSLGEGIMRKLSDKALRGDTKAIEIILDRIDGKVDSNVNFKGYLGVDTSISNEERADLIKLLYGSDNGDNTGEENK